MSAPWQLAVSGALLAWVAAWRTRWFAGIARGVAALLVGLGLGGPVDPPGGLIDLSPERPVELVGWVRGHAERVAGGFDGEERQRFEVVVEHARQGRRSLRTDERVWVSIPLESVRPAGEADRPGLGWGARVRLRGYVRQAPAWRNPGASERPGPWRLHVESRRFVEIGPSPPVRALAAGWRRALDRSLSELPGDGGALARALLLGDRSRLPERWVKALRAHGVAHVLAVSGLHVGLVAGLAWLVTAPLPRGPRLAVVAVVIALQVAAVGPRPAVLRAAIMGWTALGALALERPPLSLHALSLAVVVMLVADPSAIHDRGFVLSIAATAGLVLGAPRLVRRWAELPRPLAVGLAATVAAQLATWPFLLPWSPWLSPASPALNLVAVPWLVGTLLAALAALPLGAVGAGDLGARLLEPSWLLLDVLTEAPAWTVPVTWSAPTAVVVSGLTAAGLLWPRRVGIGLLLAALLVAGWSMPRPRGDAGDVELVVLDVGQGDALLLRRGDAGVLVDGGGWRRGDVGPRLVSALAALGVRRLDAVVLSHPDADHCRGLVDLAAYRPIAEIWTPPGWDAACAAELLGRRGVRWRPLWRGRVAAAGAVRAEVLWPPAGSRGAGNSRSLVLRVAAAGRRLLFTGDLEADAERQLLALDRSRLAADVLKVAHHGSKTSTLGPFLDAVAPRWAVVSAGRHNAYGHPHPSVVARLAERGVGVLRSDRHGAVRIAWTNAATPLRIRVADADRGTSW